MLKKYRSAPNTAVIPVLYYPDAREAVEWLTTALPFTERLRIADPRCQLSHSNGAIVVVKPGGHADAASSTLQGPGAHSVQLRVTEIDALFLRAKAAGARVLAEPADHMYGERQCSFLDPWDIRGRSRRRFSIPTQLTGAANSLSNERAVEPESRAMLDWSPNPSLQQCCRGNSYAVRPDA